MLLQNAAHGVWKYKISAEITLQGPTNSAEEPQKEVFIDGVLSKYSIPGLARQKGFEVDLAVPENYFLRRYANIPHNELLQIDAWAMPHYGLRDIAKLWDLAFFRAIPHFMKYHYNNDQKWVLSYILQRSTEKSFWYFRHDHFMESLTGDLEVSRTTPIYKLLHIMHAHRPMVVDEDCGFHGRVRTDSRKSLRDQSVCTLKTLTEFFDGLRAVEIYKDSLIIVHADHGGWIPTTRSVPIYDVHGQELPYSVMSLASPLLLYKPPGSEGPIRLSNAPASLLDIPATIATEMGWPNQYIYQPLQSLEEGQVRDRYFYYYPWHRNEWDNDFTLPIQEFLIQGSHFESNWTPQQVFKSSDPQIQHH